mgnify:CR=1 FL=1
MDILSKSQARGVDKYGNVLTITNQSESKVLIAVNGQQVTLTKDECQKMFRMADVDVKVIDDAKELQSIMDAIRRG